MTYPNAYNGIKTVFTAQILALIGIGCSLIGALAGGLGLVAGSLASGVSGGLFVIGAFVLSILSTIFTLVGLHRAAKDEEIFQKAFIWSLISLIISVLGNLLSLFGVGGSILESVVNLIQIILSIVVIAYIFKGIESLAYKLGRGEIASSGKNLLTFLYIAYGVTIFCNLMAILFPGSYGILGMIGVISLLAGIAMIVGYILYLVHLNKAKYMLTA